MFIFSHKKSLYMIGTLTALLFVLLFILPLRVGISRSNFLMVVDYGNGVERKFVGNSKLGISAWDSLQQAVAHAYVRVDVSKDFYPQMIDSWKNGKDGKEWALYINNKKISESPITIKINPGDTVVWKFE